MNIIFNFTNINHVVRFKLGLTMHEYAVADLIYHLSNNPDGVGRWCYASKEQLGEYLGLSKQAIHKILNKLLELNFIEKNDSTKHLRTTKAWYNNVIITNSKESLLPVSYQTTSNVNKNYSQSKESLLPIYDKDNNTLLRKVHAKDLHDTKKVKISPTTREQYLRICTHLEETLKMKITNWPKQMRALKMMFDAGYTEIQITKTITYMAEHDTFFKDKGFDLMTVMNQIPLIKARASKQSI